MKRFTHSHNLICQVQNCCLVKNARTLNFKHFSTNLNGKFGTDSSPIFKPCRAAILSRITRYEFEKLRHKGISEEDLKEKLDRKRSDYRFLLERHETHYKCLELMKQSLLQHGIETKVYQRPTFTNEVLDWADVIFTAGGDGTFLDAASKILTRDKPVIGVNTDPTRSEGRLCLPKEEFSATHFEAALRRLLKGDFRWKWRQRIRITMSGHHKHDDPVELHDQQLHHLEHRYIEHVNENESCKKPPSGKCGAPRVLPVRALNEVFMGESLSSRVSYYQISIDGGPAEKQKSSGVTVCTGTGSTSWFFHINHISEEDVRNILDTANRLGGLSYDTTDQNFIQKVRESFNKSLTFDPSQPAMGFSIRDPLINGVFQVSQPRGIATKIEICSRMWEASLVLDGGSSFQFNDGAIATLEMFDEDALRTVQFH